MYHKQKGITELRKRVAKVVERNIQLPRLVDSFTMLNRGLLGDHEVPCVAVLEPDNRTLSLWGLTMVPQVDQTKPLAKAAKAMKTYNLEMLKGVDYNASSRSIFLSFSENSCRLSARSQEQFNTWMQTLNEYDVFAR